MSAAASPQVDQPPPRRRTVRHKPALLVAELRGMGDLAILMPFLQTACTRFDVSLLAGPNAAGLLQRFAPEVELIPCVAPWALFSGGWNLPRWPWSRLAGVLRALRERDFHAAVSVWPLISDHIFLKLARPKKLIGFGQRGGRWLLNRDLRRETHTHRSEAWRRIAEDLGLTAMSTIQPRLRPAQVRRIVLHSGASQLLRVWPMDRYATLLKNLRQTGWSPVVLCDQLQLRDGMPWARPPPASRSIWMISWKPSPKAPHFSATIPGRVMSPPYAACRPSLFSVLRSPLYSRRVILKPVGSKVCPAPTNLALIAAALPSRFV
jgi:hypothetical protein